MSGWIEAAPGGARLRVKVVPGASRDGIVGALGDRLKVRVAAPPEHGAANRALLALLAERLGCRCELVAGHATAAKTVLVHGADPDTVRARLAPHTD